MQTLLQLLILILALLAVPVVLVYAYDKWVLEPKRPRTPEGESVPGPLYTRLARNLLPVVLIAAVLAIGVKDVFDWAGQVAVPLSWLSLPLVLWLGIDSWFFAPRRQIAAGSTEVPDPPLLRAAYFVLPVFVIAPIVRMIRAETLDFSLVLLLLSVATGVVWGLDHWMLRRRREAAAAAAKPAVALREPGTVDYARSFFPVAAIVLIVRAFIFEPFRIPSDSMMPTLLDGDFIVVNKYAYGLRMPVLNQKFLDTGSPQRGDVVVFRYPPNPNVNYIKRLVGLPGDRIEVHDDHLVINGETIPAAEQGQLHRRLLRRPAVLHRDHRQAHPRGHVLPFAARAVRRTRLRVRRQSRPAAGLRSQADRARHRRLDLRGLPDRGQPRPR